MSDEFVRLISTSISSSFVKLINKMVNKDTRHTFVRKLVLNFLSKSKEEEFTGLILRYINQSRKQFLCNPSYGRTTVKTTYVLIR